MARAFDAIVIDYVALRTKLMNRILGPYLTLFVVGSRGWPLITFSWSALDFILLYGSTHFANHWYERSVVSLIIEVSLPTMHVHHNSFFRPSFRLFYQDAIRMFSKDNPSGDIPDASWYQTLLILCIVIPFLVAVKRYYTGLAQGRRLYNRYGEELSRVMERVLFINKVGKLARDIESLGLRFENFDFEVADYQRGNSAERSPDSSGDSPNIPLESRGADPMVQGLYNVSIKARLNELLGEWEEPESARDREVS
jgi:hypothetical protein